MPITSVYLFQQHAPHDQLFAPEELLLVLLKFSARVLTAHDTCTMALCSA